MLTNRRRTTPFGRSRPAFTLIELMIVIAILLALGGLVLVNLMPRRQEADINLTSVQIDQIVSALKFFQLDMKRFPTEEEGLAALWGMDVIQDEEEAERWKGKYMDRIPSDTWGSEWIYREPSETEGFPYDIVSLGPDKEEGTEDDITNLDRLRDSEGEIAEEFTDFGSTGEEP